MIETHALESTFIRLAYSKATEHKINGLKQKQGFCMSRAIWKGICDVKRTGHFMRLQKAFGGYCRGPCFNGCDSDMHRFPENSVCGPVRRFPSYDASVRFVR